MCTFVEYFGYRLKGLLSGSVPYLQLYYLVCNFKGKRAKIDRQCHLVVFVEFVLGTSKHQARFPHPGVSNDNNFIQYVVSGRIFRQYFVWNLFESRSSIHQKLVCLLSLSFLRGDFWNCQKHTQKVKQNCTIIIIIPKNYQHMNCSRAQPATCPLHPDTAGNKIRWICIDCGRKPLCAKCVSELEHVTHNIVESSTFLIKRIQSANKLIVKMQADINEMSQQIQCEEDNQVLLQECFANLKQEVADIIDQEFVNPVLEAQQKNIQRKKYEQAKLLERYNDLSKKVTTCKNKNEEKLQTENYYEDSSNSSMENLNTLEYDFLKGRTKKIIHVSLDISKITEFKDILAQAKAIFSKKAHKGSIWKYKEDSENVLVKVDQRHLNIHYFNKRIKKRIDIKETASFSEDYFYAKIGKSIYLCTELNHFYEVTLPEPIKITKKAKLLVNRRDFKMITMYNAYIYVIGGQRENRAMGKCEKYSVAKNVWNPIPSLNNPRYQHSAFSFNHYIYVFGGNARDRVTINVFEKFDILDESAGWKVITVDIGLEPVASLNLFNTAVVQKSPYSCIMCGGRDFSGRKSACYTLDCVYNTVKKEEGVKLKHDDSFLCQPVIDDGKAFLLGMSERVYSYSFARGAWEDFI
eukprot:TRINITY_DN1078_c0_g1_i1.p2 TRINITY_DN1078_c0_g1~~TRINITY_DN1078_c0_g1_i1.p2  ORF type:complete len:635 (+),score=52.23 TRINITY_DN1078_c0_g1_i1:9499-11403(+)